MPASPSAGLTYLNRARDQLCSGQTFGNRNSFEKNRLGRLVLLLLLLGCLLDPTSINGAKLLVRTACNRWTMPPSCTSSTSITWSFDSVGRGSLLAHGCDMPIQLSQAKRCLASRHILMIGDSITRYQYLNLVHWLYTGLWESPGKKRNEVEHDWVENDWFGGWQSYYHGTNARLGGNEICDCFRGNPGQPYTQEVKLENRYYEDKDSQIRISFLLFCGSNYPFYATEPWNAGNWCRSERTADIKHDDAQAGCQHQQVSHRTCAPLPCEPGKCASPHEYSDTFEGILNISSQLGPIDSVVMASGYWQHMDTAENRLALVDFLSRLQAVSGSPQIFWKTTAAYSASAPWPQPREPGIVADAPMLGWRVSDAWHITKDIPALVQQRGIQAYWDHLHFLPWVYQGLNEMLLADLCQA